jgi:hypothetical protein
MFARDRVLGRRSLIVLVALILASSIALAIAMDARGAVAQSRSAQLWNRDPGLSAVAAAEPDLPGAHTLLLREVYTDDLTFIDVGDPGDSIGDYVIFRDAVEDWDTGQPLGVINVHCFLGYDDQCRGSITLTGDGQVVFDGVTPLGVDPDRFAITGGTGIYGGVSGQIVISFPTKDTARLALRLIGP